jgi:hypothetical protein
VFETSDLKAIDELSMDTDLAQRFTENRTRYGSVDRNLYLAVTIRPSSEFGSARDNFGRLVVRGAIERVQIFADEKMTTRLVNYTKEQLQIRMADIRRRDQERRRSETRAQIERNRPLMVETLARMPVETRLANFLDDGPISAARQLDVLRQARGGAIVGNQPVSVRMIVQTSGAGLENVATKWPGNVRLSSNAGTPPFEAGRWYLIRGKLTASPDRDSSIAVETAFACLRDLCEDASEPESIVNRKIAATLEKLE